MSSVNFVEININNIGDSLNLLLNVQNNKIIINNKEKNISKEKISELFRIIRSWQKEYGLSNIIDAEKFSIKIVSNTNTDTIIGNGIYPDNYIEFKQWVGDICE